MAGTTTMASNGQATIILRHLRKIVAPERYKQLSDRELLRRFVKDGDEAAFTAMVRRHGPMVLSVCQRVVRHRQDAEDACQATFLVLARKATSSRWRESVANWLYKVAYHLALKAKTASRRRATHESRAQPRPATDPLADISLWELQAVLDEELARLPAKYRAPLILCCLEGTARDEAARHLDWTLQTVKNRLERGRELLRARLARRGLMLSTALAGTTLAQTTAQAALPFTLVNSTGKAAALLATGKTATGVVSAQVAALVEGMSKAVLFHKVKMATAFLLAASLIAAGAGALTKRDVAAQAVKTQQEEPELHVQAKERPIAKESVGKAAPEPGMDEQGDSVTFTGRVLDPDGKPFAGAEISVWWDYVYGLWHPQTVKPPKPRVLGNSGRDGRFRLKFAKAEIEDARISGVEKPWRHCEVVAAANGYGPGWRHTYDLYQQELTLRLARDDIPIKGRVIDLQGRPVTGARVWVEQVMAGKDDTMWQNAWAGLPENLTTGKDGCFLVTGIGSNREVTLQVAGPGIENARVSVATGTTAAGKKMESATVEVVVGPTKPVEGVVRAKDTGKPLAGVAIYGNQDIYRRGVWSLTDAQGHYRLTGLPKRERGSYEFAIYPQAGLSYLGTVMTVPDSEGLKPITANIELRRGVQVRFRAIDKETRRPVRRTVQYTPLEHNPFYSEAVYAVGAFPSRVFMQARVPDKDGYFNFVAYPGPCVIFVFGKGSTPYLRPRLDPADKEKAKGDLIMGFIDLAEGYRMIDTDKTDQPLTFDIELDPGQKLTGSLIGPDDKPLTDAIAFGLHSYDRRNPGNEVLKTEVFTALAIAPQEPRTITFVHKERKLIGHVVLQGNEKEPVTVRLQPWGTLTGRLVDGTGKPLPKIRVKARHNMPAPGIWSPNESGGEVETDSQGRFRLEYLDPSLKRELLLKDGLSGGEKLKNLTVRAGEVKDLGDVSVKVTPVKKDK